MSTRTSNRTPIQTSCLTPSPTTGRLISSTGPLADEDKRRSDLHKSRQAQETDQSQQQIRTIQTRGGLQGHLGLVSSYLTYDRVSPNVPFIRPENPILPNLTVGTGPQIATARQLYAKNSAAFKICNQIERTIIQQINTAVDSDCLADLINDDTGLLEGPVPLIMK